MATTKLILRARPQPVLGIDRLIRCGLPPGSFLCRVSRHVAGPGDPLVGRPDLLDQRRAAIVVVARRELELPSPHARKPERARPLTVSGDIAIAGHEGRLLRIRSFSRRARSSGVGFKSFSAVRFALSLPEIGLSPPSGQFGPPAIRDPFGLVGSRSLPPTPFPGRVYLYALSWVLAARHALLSFSVFALPLVLAARHA